jgi:hypothetical protein
MPRDSRGSLLANGAGHGMQGHATISWFAMTRLLLYLAAPGSLEEYAAEFAICDP